MRKTSVPLSICGVSMVLVATAGCSPSIWQLAEKYETVCEGHAVEQAAEYDPSVPGIHPILVIEYDMVGGGGRYVVPPEDAQNPSEMPAAWMAESYEDLELVACIMKMSEEVLRVCHYVGEDLDSYRSTWTETLYSARTGAVIDSVNYEVEGDCPLNLTTYNHYKLQGSIDISAAFDWLAPFVEK
jgi:hypothetical protein